jgi:Zn-dependent protease with chaperone function
MPMDFIQQQEHARRRTRTLILLFIAAVATIIIVTYVVFFIFAMVIFSSRHGQIPNVLWHPQIFLAVSAGTVAVVVGGSLIKMNELSYGGSSLAMRMGGHQLNPNSTNADERKLLNVVEEMAIASGIPVPPVFVLNDEQGINAFAAGYSSKDAIIGVTRGCMKLLSRDELQGVIAHEFSHILNGDMRLNMRLIGWVFGILCLTIVGKVLLGSRREKGGVPILGGAFIIAGLIGTFFGRLIQSAVSRQREFLADASAVQFTRNPDGLAGALKKIGGLSYGSRLSTEYADEAGHLFFGNALGGGWFGAMATHPPLEERIRRIDPNFDGKFPRLAMEPEPTPLVPDKPSRQFGMLDAFGAAGSVLPPVAATAALAQVSKPLPEHLARAGGILAALPDDLTRAAHEPFDANALLYAMLLSSDDAVRATQLKSLETVNGPELAGLTVKLFPVFAGVERDARLALAQMSMPALRRLTPEQYDTFTQGVQCLIEADQQIDLFEYAIQKTAHRCLEAHFRPVQKKVVQYYALKPLIDDCAVLLSALARVGAEDEARTREAFQAGVERLRLDPNRITMTGGDDCNLAQIDAALNHLGQAAPQLRALVVDACAHTVASDGLLQAREAELLRAIADTLDCPIPPFVSQSVPAA